MNYVCSNSREGYKKYLDLAPEQWDLLSQLLVVLKALQVATKALSLEQNV